MKAMLFIFGFIILFSGCAPQYVVRNRYVPPIDNSSKLCLQNCTHDKKECKKRCDEDYSDCLSYAYEDARRIQDETNARYTEAYNLYLEDVRDYNSKMFVWRNKHRRVHKDWKYFSNRCLKSSDKYACRRERELKHVLRRLKRIRPLSPVKPRYKTFDEILVEQQHRCSRRCDCETIYDSCFVSCGGEIVPQKICVRNCD